MLLNEQNLCDFTFLLIFQEPGSGAAYRYGSELLGGLGRGQNPRTPIQAGIPLFILQTSILFRKRSFSLYSTSLFSKSSYVHFGKTQVFHFFESIILFFWKAILIKTIYDEFEFFRINTLQ